VLTDGERRVAERRMAAAPQAAVPESIQRLLDELCERENRTARGSTDMGMSSEQGVVLAAESHVRIAAARAVAEADRQRGNYGEVRVPRALLSRVCDTLEDLPALVG